MVATTPESKGAQYTKPQKRAENNFQISLPPARGLLHAGVGRPKVAPGTLFEDRLEAVQLSGVLGKRPRSVALSASSFVGRLEDKLKEPRLAKSEITLLMV